MSQSPSESLSSWTQVSLSTNPCRTQTTIPANFGEKYISVSFRELKYLTMDLGTELLPFGVSLSYLNIILISIFLYLITNNTNCFQNQYFYYKFKPNVIEIQLSEPFVKQYLKYLFFNWFLTICGKLSLLLFPWMSTTLPELWHQICCYNLFSNKFPKYPIIWPKYDSLEKNPFFPNYSNLMTTYLLINEKTIDFQSLDKT